MRCKDCKYCVNIGRAESQCGKTGRKYYYCKNEKANKEVNAFVGFGVADDYKSEIKIKTTPRWCPLKLEAEVEE